MRPSKFKLHRLNEYFSVFQTVMFKGIRNPLTDNGKKRPLLTSYSIIACYRVLTLASEASATGHSHRHNAELNGPLV